jgi:hypothetical protein
MTPGVDERRLVIGEFVGSPGPSRIYVHRSHNNQVFQITSKCESLRIPSFRTPPLVLTEAVVARRDYKGNLEVVLQDFEKVHCSENPESAGGQ